MSLITRPRIFIQIRHIHRIRAAVIRVLIVELIIQNKWIWLQIQFLSNYFSCAEKANEKTMTKDRVD
jgi:hypothetical protein